MTKQILVSIGCITYNQEKTVKKMLDSLLKQKTKFRYEIIIHDDCSTDSTTIIIRDYAKRYSDRIVALFEKENQYSKGKHIFQSFIYPIVRGKYIAYCEGDDYWTDEYKLQKQFDNMENHPECSICVHDVSCVNRKGKFLNASFPGIEIEEGVIPKNKYFELEFVKKHWLFQTTSYFVRSDIVKKMYDLRPDFLSKYPVGDLSLVLFSLLFGDCYYIKSKMSVYRKDSGGIMTINKKRLDKEITYYNKMIEGHCAFNDYTRFKYDIYINKTIDLTKFYLLKIQGKYREIDRNIYEKTKDVLSLSNKVILFTGKIFPNITYKVYMFVHKFRI